MTRYHGVSPGAVLGVVEGLKRAGFVTVQEVGGHLKVTLDGVDGAVTTLHRYGGWLLYTRPVQALMWLVAMAGLGAAFWSALRDGPGLPAAAVWHPGVYFAFVLLNALVHEAAHALTCKAHGGEVRRVGLGLFCGMPILFVDTSDIWMQPRRARVAVSWAGPFLHLVAGGTLALGLALWPENPWAAHRHALGVSVLCLSHVSAAGIRRLLHADGLPGGPPAEGEGPAVPQERFVAGIFTVFGIFSAAYSALALLQLFLWGRVLVAR